MNQFSPPKFKADMLYKVKNTTKVEEIKIYDWEKKKVR